MGFRRWFRRLLVGVFWVALIGLVGVGIVALLAAAFGVALVVARTAVFAATAVELLAAAFAVAFAASKCRLRIIAAYCLARSYLKIDC